MKKMFYTFVALFTLQIGFAQVSSEAKTYIKNSGISEQLDATKTQILPSILEENVADFNKDYDAAVKGYISELETLVHDNFDAADLKKYNESLADRKSTRLNSSHVRISYAVFCLKKKKIKQKENNKN